MKTKIIFLFLILSGLVAARPILEYKNFTTMPIDSSQLVKVFVGNPEGQPIVENVSCSSVLNVTCPNVLKIDAGEVGAVPIYIKSGFETGKFFVNFSVGDEQGQVTVNVLKSPESLEFVIERYEKQIDELNANKKEIESVKKELNVAKDLLQKGMYTECINILKVVKNDIEELENRPEEKRTGDVEWLVVGLFILAIGSVFYFGRREKPVEVKPDISDLIRLRRVVGRPSMKRGEIDLKTIEREIKRLERLGEDVSMLKTDLNVIKKLRREGRTMLAKKYMEKLSKRFEWDLGD